MAKLKKYNNGGEAKELAKKRRKGNIVSAIINPFGFVGTKAGEAIREGKEAQKVLEEAGLGDTKAGSGKGKEIMKNLFDKLLPKEKRMSLKENIMDSFKPSGDKQDKVVEKKEEPKKEDKVGEERKNVEKVEPKKAGPISSKSSSPNPKKARLVTSEKEGEEEVSEDKQKKQPVSKTPSRLDRQVQNVKKMKLDLDTKPKATLVKKEKSKLSVDGKSKKKEQPKKKKRVYNPRTNKFEFR
jgi:hypothetical protein